MDWNWKFSFSDLFWSDHHKVLNDFHLNCGKWENRFPVVNFILLTYFFYFLFLLILFYISSAGLINLSPRLRGTYFIEWSIIRSQWFPVKSWLGFLTRSRKTNKINRENAGNHFQFTQKLTFLGIWILILSR